MLLCDFDDFRMLLMEFTQIKVGFAQFSKHVREFIHILSMDPRCNSEIPERFLFWGLVFHGRRVWKFTDASCKYETSCIYGYAWTEIKSPKWRSSKHVLSKVVKNAFLHHKTFQKIATEYLHTTLYGSAAGCRSIQKTCALWKHGLTSKNTQCQLTYFCKSNINQTFTNGGVMIWGVRIAIFTEIRHLVEELITFLSIFGLQKWGILTARLNKSLSISTSIQWEGISVLKHAQNLHSQQG